jgi:competence protein ComFC
MNKSLVSLFDFFLPRICPGCDRKLSTDEKQACSECLTNILKVDKNLLEYEFDRKFRSDGIISDFYSGYIFEADKTLQHIIHSMKYEKKFRLGIFLGELLSEGIQNRNWQIDWIVPVPIHHLKQAERGYNQSDYIAKGLSKSLNIPWSNKKLKRVRYTQSQTQLNQNEREENVSDAFQVKKLSSIKEKNFLLVDDVITTGATILECAKVLINSGAKSVYACSVGIAE